MLRHPKHFCLFPLLDFFLFLVFPPSLCGFFRSQTPNLFAMAPAGMLWPYVLCHFLGYTLVGLWGGGLWTEPGRKGQAWSRVLGALASPPAPPLGRRGGAHGGDGGGARKSGAGARNALTGAGAAAASPPERASRVSPPSGAAATFPAGRAAAAPRPPGRVSAAWTSGPPCAPPPGLRGLAPN